jgi:putative membrane protein
MWTDHFWMGSMWMLPSIMFVVVLFIIFTLIIRRGGRYTGDNYQNYHSNSGNDDKALDILKKRYAKGDITKEEYEEVKKTIS